MASTITKPFNSAMPGVPALSGTAGALVALLDALLVNGFGLQSASSLVVAGGIATATFATAHSMQVGSVALLAGASPAGLNGEKRVLSVATNSYTFDATGIGDQTAGGSISSKVAPAGWTKQFTGTNLAVYKPAAPAATGCVLRVDDTGTTNARVRAYESMNDVSTGVGPTPLDSQMSGGLYWPKSGAANGTARPWVLVADDRGFHLAVSPQGTDRYTLLYAGDIASLKSGDAYGYLITGNQADQTAATGVPDGCCGWSHRSARTGAYLMRAHTGIGQSIAAQRLGAHHNGGTSDVYAGTAGYSIGTYPNGPNNGLMTGALELHAMGIRGTVPGLLHPVQDCGGAFASGGTVDGTNDLGGRTLLSIRVAPPSGAVTPGSVFLDMTGPWAR